MHKKIRNILVVIMLFFTLFIILELKYYKYESITPVKKLYPVPKIYQRVLIFAPHPDDETLASAGLIQDTIKYGGKVKIVVMTNGDSFKRAVIENYDIINPKPYDFLHLGYTRQIETINALKYLGLDNEDVIFLGYPDKGLAELWWKYWNKPFRSFGTKKIYSPYKNSYTKSAEYTGKNVVNDIVNIINNYEPTLIVYPHPNEIHPDHWSTNSFVKYALYTMKKNDIDQFLYIVHRTDWPLPFGMHTKLNLNPPKNLLQTQTVWNLYPLSKDAILKKGNAIMLYKTQIKVMKDFLLAFDRKTELFGFYPDGNIYQYNNKKNIDDYEVIIDPKYDNLIDYENGSLDITDVYAYEGKNNLKFAIKCRKEAKSNYEYNIYGIIFKDNKEIKRFSKTIINGKLIGNEGTGEIKNGIVYFTIPKAKDFDAIYLCASSINNKHLVNKTAWHLLIRKQN